MILYTTLRERQCEAARKGKDCTNPRRHTSDAVPERMRAVCSKGVILAARNGAKVAIRCAVGRGGHCPLCGCDARRAHGHTACRTISASLTAPFCSRPGHGTWLSGRASDRRRQRTPHTHPLSRALPLAPPARSSARVLAGHNAWLSCMATLSPRAHDVGYGFGYSSRFTLSHAPLPHTRPGGVTRAPPPSS